MILDDIKNLSAYESVGFNSKKVLEFINKAAKENLSQGRYELDGDNLFALIQVYETKNREECLYEAHKLYGDIQYIVDGYEKIYAANIDLLDVVEDRTPGEDILFYDRSLKTLENKLASDTVSDKDNVVSNLQEEADLSLRPGSFAIFLPQDGHMPCCVCKEKQKVKKIVFKFRVKEA